MLGSQRSPGRWLGLTVLGVLLLACAAPAAAPAPTIAPAPADADPVHVVVNRAVPRAGATPRVGRRAGRVGRVVRSWRAASRDPESMPRRSRSAIR